MQQLWQPLQLLSWMRALTVVGHSLLTGLRFIYAGMFFASTSTSTIAVTATLYESLPAALLTFPNGRAMARLILYCSFVSSACVLHG
jgi:hypothetical protein